MIEKKRYGIFGGTFDPVHIGHLILAEEALSQLNLDQVLWVLTPFSPHKVPEQITPTHIRLKLLQAAIEDNPSFVLSTVDMDREPPHYAVDTLRILRAQIANSHLVYLIGGDSLGDLPRWHQPHLLLELTDELGVMRRPGYPIHMDRLEKELPGIKNKIAWIEAPCLEISSSQIRKKIQSGQAFRYYLHPRVYFLIKEHGFYHAPPRSSK